MEATAVVLVTQTLQIVARADAGRARRFYELACIAPSQEQFDLVVTYQQIAAAAYRQARAHYALLAECYDEGE